MAVTLETKHYYTIRLSNVPRDLEEEVSEQLFDLGASGLNEVLSFTPGADAYEVEPIFADPFTLEAYFENPISLEAFEPVKHFDKSISIEMQKETHKDWMSEWKKGFHAFELMNPYWVVPSWESVPSQCTHPLRIDPGMAFGTGTHDTTKAAAQFTVEWFQGLRKNAQSPRVLDVGTGTGILAMIAAYEKASIVYGTEIDPVARETAKENILLNKLESTVQISDDQVENFAEKNEKFDLVIANIIDGILLKLKPYLLAVMKPDAKLILSGILVEREGSFAPQFLTEDLVLEKRICKGEWLAYQVGFKAQTSEKP
jgi:ribosomal protein L11 methyltransferase